LRPGDLALSLGASGTAFTLADAPTSDATGAVAGFADATGRFLPLVCTLNATKVTDTVARLLGAAVQAAVALTGASFEQVADAWDLGAGTTIEPDPAVDAAEIGGRHAVAVGA
jgi:sugar (pentulose or hexulose) kinase